MKIKKISISLIAIMLTQLLSFTSFAESNTVTGFNADTSGIYLYGDGLTEEMLTNSVLTTGANNVSYTVSEVGITEAMKNYTNPPISKLITGKAFKLTPSESLKIGQIYSLSVNDGVNTEYSKTFYLKELFADDFSVPNKNQYWTTADATKNQSNGYLEIRGTDKWSAYRSVFLSDCNKYFDETDYTLELDFIPQTDNSSAMGFAFSKTQMPPKYDDGNNDARFVFDGADSAGYYKGVYSAHSGSLRAPTPYFPDLALSDKGLEAGRKYHIKAAFQEGNTKLSVYLSSEVNGSDVEYILYNYDVNADGGAFSFVMNLYKDDMPAEGPYVILDNISMTKAIDLGTMKDAAIDEGTTLTSKGFTFYSVQDFDTNALKDYIRVSKNGTKVDNVTITKLNKKTIKANTNAKEIKTNNVYRVNLPEQITQSGDIYTLELFKGLTDSTGEYMLKNNYTKNMMLNVLLYDNFDNYTGTVATGKDSTGKLVRESTGTEADTWLGNAWIFENNGNWKYDTHAVMSIDNGRLKFDYKNEEDALSDDVRCNNNGRIMSAAYANHTEWRDYTVEYDLTPLETRYKYFGGIYPRANATGNTLAPLFYRSGFDLFSNDKNGSCYVAISSSGTEVVPTLNEASHIEATATASSDTDSGSYSLIVDNDYFCKVTNNTVGGEADFVTATGTPRFGAMSDQDFCMDNLVVSTFEEVSDDIMFMEPVVSYNGGTTVAESASISGTIEILNGYTEVKPIVVIMAAYDGANRQMKKAVVLKDGDLKIGKNSIPFSEFDVDGADSVKVFAFTSLGTIMPYDEELVID